MNRKLRFAFITYLLLLLGYTVYLLCDAFLLSVSYDSGASEMNTAMFENQTETVLPTAAKITSPGGNKGRFSYDRNVFRDRNTDDTKDTETKNTDTTGFLSDMRYQDENITVNVTEYREYDTQIYVADITLSSAQYFKTAFAKDTYGKNVTAKTSVTAQEHQAILAINGDYYGAQEKGYVIRNGIVYRNTAKGNDLLCLYANGVMKIVNDREYTAEDLVRDGVWQAFSFGPALLADGEVTVGIRDEVGLAMVSNPRTAVGMIEENHFVFVVSDGRTSQSKGLSLYELACFLKDLGVRTAYNLDGGGSSVMVFNGRIINNPTTNGRINERSVSDIVYIR